MEQANSAIQFQDVTKLFSTGDRAAVDNISFEVKAGQLVVLLGPSGCGKTTTLKMVNRLIEPSSGVIYVNGTSILEIGRTQLRREIGYVIQQIGLFPHMTVAQNVAVVPELLRWPASRIQERVDELLATVELPPQEYRDRYPSQLSGGQQQRVGVARALAGDPRVILMDEPFGAVDAITRSGLQEELRRLHQRLHKTILFVTHDVDEALRLADRIVVMRDGHIVQYDTPFDVLTKPADEFVYRLVGAEDMVRQLGLLRVESAMAPLPPQEPPADEPTIGSQDDLHMALSLLLRTGAPRLIVLTQGAPAGILTFDNIRAWAEKSRDQ